MAEELSNEEVANEEVANEEVVNEEVGEASETIETTPPISKQQLALEQSFKEAEAKQTEEKLQTQQKILNKAVDDFVVLDENGNKVVCSKENTIATEIDGQVSYRCRTQEQALGEDKTSQRGEGETNQLIDDLLQSSNQTDEKTLKLSVDELKKLEAAKAAKAQELQAQELKQQAEAQERARLEEATKAKEKAVEKASEAAKNAEREAQEAALQAAEAAEKARKAAEEAAHREAEDSKKAAAIAAEKAAAEAEQAAQEAILKAQEQAEVVELKTQQLEQKKRAQRDIEAEEKAVEEQPAVDTIQTPGVGEKALENIIIENESKPSEKGTDVPAKAIDIKDIKEDGFVGKTGDFLKKLPIKAYLSLRANAAITNKGNPELSDGGTRGGLIYAKRLENDDQLILHAEIGSNIFDKLNGVIDSDSAVEEKTVLSRRLSYVRYGRDDYYALFGKNWSVYHFIAEMTDRFIAVGGKASGIYNAGTDGGATGSGRADQALQLRSSRGNMQWGIQVQSNNAIPQLTDKVKYELNAALSAKWKSINGFSIGVGVNRAVPEQYTNEMLGLGLDGSSTATVLGIEWRQGDWAAATTFSSSDNHVTDPTGQYYDARGWELYSSRILTPRTTARFGWNWQQPNDDDYLGQHEIKEVYLSYEYRYNASNVQDKVYAEYIVNQGTNADGSSAGDLLVVGVRYNFSN